MGKFFVFGWEGFFGWLRRHRWARGDSSTYANGRPPSPTQARCAEGPKLPFLNKNCILWCFLRKVKEKPPSYFWPPPLSKNFSAWRPLWSQKVSNFSITTIASTALFCVQRQLSRKLKNLDFKQLERFFITATLNGQPFLDRSFLTTKR